MLYLLLGVFLPPISSMTGDPPEKTVRAWRLAAIIGSMINGKMRSLYAWKKAIMPSVIKVMMASVIM